MKPAEQKKIKKKDSEKRVAGSTAQIRDVVQKVESKIKSGTPDKRIRKILKVLKKRDKEEIVQAVLEKYYDSEELKPYQAELIKLQVVVIPESLRNFMREGPMCFTCVRSSFFMGISFHLELFCQNRKLSNNY